VPDEGFLPVFSVGDEEEAKQLITLTCSRGYGPTEGQYISRELSQSQTLENLELFSTKLDRAHDFMKEKGHCRCKKGK
jgi:adenylosuccinate synthase